MSMTTLNVNRQLASAQYEVNRLHNIMQECPEGWHVVTDDGEWTYRSTEREAHEYARECAAEGMLAAVVQISAKYQPEPIEDMDDYNGVTPGVDYPETLNRASTWAA